MYTTTGKLENINAGRTLNRYSAFVFRKDWYRVGNKEMDKQASSMVFPKGFQCKLFIVT